MTGEPITFTKWWQSRRNPFWNATETVKHSTEELARAAFLAGMTYQREQAAHTRKTRDDITFEDHNA